MVSIVAGIVTIIISGLMYGVILHGYRMFKVKLEKIS